MKKLFLTLALAFVGIFSANAQLWMGDSVNGSIQKNNYVTGNDIALKVSPEIGYSFEDSRWTIAAGLTYQYNLVKQMQLPNDADPANPIIMNDVKTNRFILSPYVRYTACTIEKFSLFLDLVGDIDVLSPQMYEVGLKPGIAWMATEHWTAAFRFGFLGYDHLFERGNGFFLDCGLGTSSIGLYYNF